jgi:hypothetical protein
VNLFIHIPKTAGTSIKKILNCSICLDSKFIGHEPLFLIEQCVSDFDRKKYFIFTVVRNPFTRAFSYYKHFCRINNVNIQFSDFLYLIKTKMSPLFNFDNKNYTKTPLVLFNQSFYLFNKNNEIDIDKLYRFENLQDLENDHKISLPKENVGNYNLIEYLNCYSEKNINCVKDIYSQDFDNFSYSKNFVDSLNVFKTK